MIRILFLINTLRGGGAEKTLINLVNNLPGNQYDITVQTIDNSGVYISQLNSNIHYKTINNKKGFIRKVFNHILTFNLSAKWIYNTFIKSDYDVEIAFMEGLPTKIISASTNQKTTKIAWVHTDLMNYFDSSAVYKNVEENKKAYQKFDKIACVSEDCKRKFIERFGDFGDKLQTVYNVILDDDIRKKGNEKLDGIKHDYPIVISCGRLCEQKGFDRLLRVHKKLIDGGIKHYLWIVGDGNLRSDFENYIKENNISDTVFMWGFQPNPYKYMKNADLFVCSSVAEGYSTVVTESVVLGIPVLSTNVAGANEPKENPRSYRVVENNEESLYEGLKLILTNPKELEKAKQYTKNISKAFTKEKYLCEIIALIVGGIE